MHCTKLKDKILLSNSAISDFHSSQAAKPCFRTMTFYNNITFIRSPLTFTRATICPWSYLTTLIPMFFVSTNTETNFLCIRILEIISCFFSQKIHVKLWDGLFWNSGVYQTYIIHCRCWILKPILVTFISRHNINLREVTIIVKIQFTAAWKSPPKTLASGSITSASTLQSGMGEEQLEGKKIG